MTVIWWDISRRPMARRLANKINQMNYRGVLFGFKWMKMPDHWVVRIIKNTEAYIDPR